MSDPRATVLAAITRQLRGGTLPPGASMDHPGPPTALPGGEPGAALVDRFAAALEALAGQVTRASSPAEAIGAVRAILARYEATRVLAWDEPWIECPGLFAALSDAGVRIEPCWLPTDRDARAARLADLDAVPVGLTGATAGLAETGSLVMVSGPGRGRMASLLTPVHVAILPVARLYPSLAAFLAAHPSITDEGSNLVAITGPSRTADIEMTLTRGVHGPKYVHVILV